MPALPMRVPLSMLSVAAIIAIILTLFGVTVAVMRKARLASDESKTLDNLRKCAQAVHGAHDNNKKFPPYYGIYGAAGGSPATFHTHLLPFVDAHALFAVHEPVRDSEYLANIIPNYLAPLDPTRTDNGANATNFALNIRLYYLDFGLGTLSPSDKPIYPKMPNTFQGRGTSNTLLFATKYMHCGADGGSLWNDPGHNAVTSRTAATFGVSMDLWQQAPSREKCNPAVGTAVSFTSGSIHIALCDASVRSLSVGINQKTWQSVHTPYVHDEGSDWDQ